MPSLAPTPRDTLLEDGSARLYRFRRPGGPADVAVQAGRRDAASPLAPAAAPILLVPSMINRWYVLDLRPGTSLVEAFVSRGLDVYCLDWGVPRDEDRYLGWDDVVARIGRAVRRVRRESGAKKVSVLGYCMGGTLSAIYAALSPDDVASLVDLAGPIDFGEAGFLRAMVDPRWFDAGAIAEAGNVAPHQMQAGFVALRPTTQISKWVGLLDKGHDPLAREAFEALEAWASDNIPFPAAAYQTYIEELYQENALVRGEHHVRGRRVDLGAIRCPVMVVSADRDAICPPDAASALLAHVGTPDVDKTHLAVPGGHVGAVVGSRAPKALYPAIADFFRRIPCDSMN